MGLWALCTSCAHETPHAGPEVNSFKIKGNEGISDGTIKDKIVTEATGWWPFAKRKDYDPVTWDKDRARVERLYASRGYYQAKVQASQVPAQVARNPDAEVDVVMQVTEGPRATLHSLELEGLETLEEKQRAKLQRRLPLKPKEPFTEGEWQETKDVLQTRLRDSGHAEAQVQGRALVDLEHNKVDATVWLRPGPIYRFGDIVVEQGRPPHVESLWIEEQVRLAAPLNEVFTPEALDEAQRRVFAMNVFTRADVELGPPNPENGRIPLVVKTQTGPYHLLRLGGGASFDQVRNVVRVIGEWTNNNFLGGLRTLRLRSSLGWAFLPNAYRNITGSGDAPLRNGPVGLIGADFEQPRMFGKPAWKFGYHVEGERQLQEAFTAISGRSGPELIWQVRSDLRLSAGYMLEASRITTLSSVDPLQNELILSCEDPKCDVWISHLSQRATYDRRDDPMAPRRGFYFDVQFQEAGGPLSGSFSYFRTIGDVRGYISFGKFTFAARAQLGGLFPTSGDSKETPIQHRLYAGGGMSMRGFGYRRLSPLLAVVPQDRQPDPDDPKRRPPGPEDLQTVVIGGNGLFVSNLETRYKISPSILLAAFYDTGAVTVNFRSGGSPPGLDGNELFHAVGGGIRFLTPVGAIRLDIARRFPGSGSRWVNYPTSNAGVGGPGTLTENTSCFGFGGGGAYPLSDGLCQIHLSIGEAF